MRSKKMDIEGVVMGRTQRQAIAPIIRSALCLPADVGGFHEVWVGNCANSALAAIYTCSGQMEMNADPKRKPRQIAFAPSAPDDSKRRHSTTPLRTPFRHLTQFPLNNPLHLLRIMTESQGRRGERECPIVNAQAKGRD
jgi:hypothetical protein